MGLNWSIAEYRWWILFIVVTVVVIFLACGLMAKSFKALLVSITCPYTFISLMAINLIKAGDSSILIVISI